MVAGRTFALACPPGFDPLAIERHIDQHLSADAFRIALADVAQEHLIAEAGGIAAGYVTLSTDPAPSQLGARRLLELRRIYVLPEHHGSGLADELMRRTIERAAELGFEGVHLGTSKVNRRALAFYRRHGFEVAAERVFMVGGLPNEDWILVRLG